MVIPSNLLDTPKKNADVTFLSFDCQEPGPRIRIFSLLGGGYSELRALKLACRMVSLKGMSLHTGPDNLIVNKMIRQRSGHE